MTDDILPPPFPASPSPSPPPPPPPRPSSGQQLRAFLASDNLLARASVLGFLTLVLIVPLNMIGGVITDRRSYETEATKSVSEAWGGPQLIAGPTIILPYRRTDGQITAFLRLLPEKLVIDGRITPEQRRRGLFAVNVYSATLDVVADFQTAELRAAVADNRIADWAAAHLEIGLSDVRAIEGATVEVDGQRLDWNPGTDSMLSSLKANLGTLALDGRDTVSVRFSLTLAGSGKLGFLPLGRRTEATLSSPWPAPSFTGRSPISQMVDKDGFRARWSASSLGRPYGQLWDSAGLKSPAPDESLLASALGVTLLTPVDAYRETDRAIKYGIMFIGLTFAACLLFELATGTRPHVAQYGLIGLALCVFYLLLLSIAEQIGFGFAYLASASAVVAQATLYNWALRRRLGPAIAFGAILAGLYAGLYSLLQLEDVAMLTGSVVLFAVLSVAMWLTRNLHCQQPA
ncbi:MAG: cell envelope integrity protein CreD [Rhodospirillales bacterium]|nr:cell envelope integrity protein CreD [Rhodospirillales bacterium]